MTVNDTDDGHWTADDDAIVEMPASNQTVIANVSTVCVLHIGHLTVSCSIRCLHVDLVHALHVIPARNGKKHRNKKKHE